MITEQRFPGIAPDASTVSGEQILIEGATGTLGSRLVRQLAAVGVEPRVLVRTPEKAEQLASLATPFSGDLLAPESLKEAFRGVERVFVLGQPTADMETLELAALLSEVVRRDVHVVEGVAPVGYFGLVAAGLYFPTDTAAKLLGRSPRTYREWLDDHAPAAAISRSSHS